MSFEYETEKREFVRIKTDIPVRYKYLSRTIELADDGIYEGTTRNLSGSGLLLVGRLPGAEWIAGLLMEKIVVGINILLPSMEEPIKALTRVAWIESIRKGTDRCAMGLRFKEITKDNQDEIFKYVIKSQIG